MKKRDADLVKSNLENGENVQAEMTWSLPAPDDRVEWSLWTTAVDTTSAVSTAGCSTRRRVPCVPIASHLEGFL